MIEAAPMTASERLADGLARRPTSLCSCPLPPGCWGEHGWHFFVFDEACVRRAVRRALAGAGELSLQDRARFEASAKEEAELYLGTFVAYAPCPHYRRAVRDAQDRERVLAAAKRGGVE